MTPNAPTSIHKAKVKTMRVEQFHLMPISRSPTYVDFPAPPENPSSISTCSMFQFIGLHIITIRA